jgi:hypothetical protein
MPDLVAGFLSPEQIRHVAVWALAVSAGFVFVFAFAGSDGAGFRCPVAMLRFLYRLFMCCLAIALAYDGAWVASHEEYVPPGPMLIVLVSLMLVLLVSAVRHMLAPAVAADNSWGGAARYLKGAVHEWRKPETVETAAGLRAPPAADKVSMRRT